MLKVPSHDNIQISLAHWFANVLEIDISKSPFTFQFSNVLYMLFYTRPFYFDFQLSFV